MRHAAAWAGIGCWSLFLPVAVAQEHFEPVPEQLRSMVHEALSRLIEEEEHRADFLYRARTERNELDSAGKVSDRHTHTTERVEIEGHAFARTVERDGKPLPEADRKAEELAIRTRLAELKAPAGVTTAGVGGAMQSRPLRRGKQDDWYLELPEALDFKLAGEETIAGRATWRLSARPKPGYQPKNMRARVFEKMQAKLLIDKASGELVRVDAEMFDTVSVGFGVLGKVEKGTNFKLQRRLMPEGVWLIDAQSIRFTARILLLRTVRTESATTWTDFRLRPGKQKAAAGASK